jgi:hypothetical protein
MYHVGVRPGDNRKKGAGRNEAMGAQHGPKLKINAENSDDQEILRNIFSGCPLADGTYYIGGLAFFSLRAAIVVDWFISRFRRKDLKD